MAARFICDDNLGKLARYLRMLGCDAAFKNTVSDAELIAAVLKENRVALTRDHKLVKRIEPERHFFIEDDSPEEQLKAVIKHFCIQIDDELLFSRCLECNEICQAVSAQEISNEVFPYILKKHSEFTRCPSCRRIYWPGTHYKAMTGKLGTIIHELRSS